MIREPVMTPADLVRFLDTEFVQAKDLCEIEEIGPMTGRFRMRPGEGNLRPGGTVSGPAMFALADVAVYLTLVAMIGPVALAVTTNASIDFMRKPQAGRDLIAETRLLKLGRVLAVGDVLIRADGSEDAVARATLTYSIPPH